MSQQIVISMQEIHLFDLPENYRCSMTKEFKNYCKSNFRKTPGYSRNPAYRSLTNDINSRSNSRVTLSIKSLKEVQRIVGIDVTYIENNVVSICIPHSQREYYFKFPIQIDKNWAFLMGMFHSCGGFSTKYRRLDVRFAVEHPVAKELTLICKNMGIITKYLINYTRPKWLPNVKYLRKKDTVSCGRFVLEIFFMIGLERHDTVRSGEGRYASNRHLQSKIPDWIASSKLIHHFIEGYIAGYTGQSFITKRSDDLRGVHSVSGGIHIRFLGDSDKNVISYSQPIIKYLESLGITGHWRKHCCPGVIKYNLYIHSRNSLQLFYNQFRIIKPSIRIRTQLRINSNALLCKILQRIDYEHILPLGFIIDKSLSREELNDVFNKDMSNSVNHLLKRGIIVENNGLLEYDPSVIRKQMVQEYNKQVEKYDENMIKAVQELNYRCTKCQSYSFNLTCDLCDCVCEPIERKEVAGKNMRRKISAQIQIKNLGAVKI